MDGGQHNESERDRQRDAFLSSEGYRVLRFWNSDILTNMDGVLAAILEKLEALPDRWSGVSISPTPTPPLKGRG